MGIMQVCVLMIALLCSTASFLFASTDNQNDFVFDPTTQLSFTTGSFSACVDIEILDDDNIEGDHQFEVLITDATLGTILITSSVTTITIIDNAGTCDV